MKRTGLLVGFAALATALVFGQGGQARRTLSQARGGAFLTAPAWSPDGASIAWAESNPARPDAMQIWTASSDGSHARPLADAGGGDQNNISQVRWLPGNRMFYVSWSALFLWRSGHGSALLTDHAFGSFSVDAKGARVAGSQVNGSSHGVGRVYVVDVRTGAVHKIGNERDQNVEPTLSPNGRLVAFARYRCFQNDCAGHPAGVWVASATTGKVVRRIAREGLCATWSPDGKHIAYLNGRPPGSLYVTTPEGKGTRRLLTGVGCVLEGGLPSFSPDGRKLTVQSASTGRMFVVDVRTGAAKAVGGQWGNSAWSPDSRSLLFVKSTRGCGQLALADAKTGRTRTLPQPC